MKEDFTPPKASQLHHVFGEQEGFLQRWGNVTTYTPIEVPDWCIIHQGLTTKHGSWKTCSGLGELNIFSFRSSAWGVASFLLPWRPVSLFFIGGTRSSCLHCLLTLWFLSPPNIVNQEGGKTFAEFLNSIELGKLGLGQDPNNKEHESNGFRCWLCCGFHWNWILRSAVNFLSPSRLFSDRKSVV